MSDIMLTRGHTFAQFDTIQELQDAVSSERIDLERFEGLRYQKEWTFQRYDETSSQWAQRVRETLGLVAPGEKPRARYDLNKLRKAFEVIAEFDAFKLSLVDLYDGDKRIPLSVQELKEHEYCGLSNAHWARGKFFNINNQKDRNDHHS